MQSKSEEQELKALEREIERAKAATKWRPMRATFVVSVWMLLTSLTLWSLGLTALEAVRHAWAPSVAVWIGLAILASAGASVRRNELDMLERKARRPPRPPPSPGTRT